MVEIYIFRGFKTYLYRTLLTTASRVRESAALGCSQIIADNCSPETDKLHDKYEFIECSSNLWMSELIWVVNDDLKTEWNLC